MIDATPRERVDVVMRSLELREGEFFLGGSAGLALRDLRHVGDIDIGVTTRLWLHLQALPEYQVWTPPPSDEWTRCDPPFLVRHVGSTEVNVFSQWRRRGAEETPYNDYNLVFRDGLEFVGGWPCIKLEILLRQKIDAVLNGPPVREKDVEDIVTISKFMSVNQ